MERNQIGKNETAAIRKYEHTGECFYSCKVCGNTFVANPPDDVHKHSSIYQCWKFDWIERSYQCSICGKSTKLLWHPELHKHHYFATVEEIEHKTSKNALGSNHLKYMQRMEGY